MISPRLRDPNQLGKSRNCARVRSQKSTERRNSSLMALTASYVEKLPESLAFLSEIIDCQLHRG